MLFYVAFIGFVVSLSMESITSWMLIKGSKKHHPDLWKHAGEPTLMSNGDLISAFSLINYVWCRDYEGLNNRDAIKYADQMRLPVVLSYWAAWIFALVLIYAVFLTPGTA